MHSRDGESGSRPAGQSLSGLSLDLLARVKRHEPDAWRQLVKLFSPLVY